MECKLDYEKIRSAIFEILVRDSGARTDDIIIELKNRLLIKEATFEIINLINNCLDNYYKY